MTREEAILRLKNVDIRDAEQEDYGALGMAIKALEQEPCEDAISRQAVLDMICNVDGMEGFENSNIFAKHYVNNVKALPSVKPQPKVGKWIIKSDSEKFAKWTECSECEYKHNCITYEDKFCPNCGAKMKNIISRL